MSDATPDSTDDRARAATIPMSGDDLERIDATGSCDESEFSVLVQTALHYRQTTMDAGDDAQRLRAALREAAKALEAAGFVKSADDAWRAAEANGRGGA